VDLESFDVDAVARALSRMARHPARAARDRHRGLTAGVTVRGFPAIHRRHMTKFTIDYADTPFLATSQTNPNPVRLNWRCEMLLTRNRHMIEGQRVLDLASHDGRFTYACLRLGASSVLGVEGRPHLVANARENLAKLGIEEARFRFESGDIFDWLPRFEPGSFDVILCLGFLYHTIRQVEFFQHMERLRPKFLILDSDVELFRGWTALKLLRFVNRLRSARLSPGGLRELWSSLDEERAVLFFHTEDSRVEGSTIERSDVVGRPTAELLARLMALAGFEPRRLPWEGVPPDDRSGLRSYQTGERVSYVGERTR
jgi:SAM-dependent methyltransferase